MTAPWDSARTIYREESMGPDGDGVTLHMDFPYAIEMGDRCFRLHPPRNVPCEVDCELLAYRLPPPRPTRRRRWRLRIGRR